MNIEYQCLIWMLILIICAFCTGGSIGIVIGIRAVEKEQAKVAQEET